MITITRATRLTLAAAAVVIALLATPSERANAHQWSSNVSSAYGPGLWGNLTACRKPDGSTRRLQRDTIGVAHRTLPCNTKLTLRRGGKWVNARVIDRGPWTRCGSGYCRDFDLTEATVRRLGVSSCASWGERSVAWHGGWVWASHR